MPIHLDHLRPSVGRGIASFMCALFSFLSIGSLAYAIHRWRSEFGMSNGVPFFMKVTDVVFSVAGALVVFYVAVKFGLYALRKHDRSG